MDDISNNKVLKVFSLEFVIAVITVVFSMGMLYNQNQATASDVEHNTQEIKVNSEVIQISQVRLERIETNQENMKEALLRISEQLARVEQKVDNE